MKLLLPALGLCVSGTALVFDIKNGNALSATLQSAFICYWLFRIHEIKTKGQNSEKQD